MSEQLNIFLELWRVEMWGDSPPARPSDASFFPHFAQPISAGVLGFSVEILHLCRQNSHFEGINFCYCVTTDHKLNLWKRTPLQADLSGQSCQLTSGRGYDMGSHADRSA